MNFSILVCDNVHQEGVNLLLQRTGFRVELNADPSPDSLRPKLAECHALVVRSATKVTGELLQGAPNLKVIGRAGTGVDNIDVNEATRRGIVVMNTPGGNTVAAAEQTIALIMAAHRHIPQAVASMKMGKWEKKRFQGREMAGKTLGVIGLGRIGSLVAERGRHGLKMNVLGYDPVTTPETAARLGARLCSLDELYEGSDVITVHTPLSKDTEGLIDARAFGKMKEGVVIVNCARGGIIDEEALLEALESGKIACAALDVFKQTPPSLHPLVEHPAVIATPHLGASTGEAQVNVAVSIAKQIIDYLEQGLIRNAVNVPAIDASQIAVIGPYLDLARRMAQFLARISPAGIKAMEVEYRGEIAKWDFHPITNAALVGLLSGFEGSEVNTVNASMIAEQRGIGVSETTVEEAAEPGSSLRIRAGFVNGTCLSVQGALIGRVGYEPRITGIDEFITEAVPAGPMLIVRNRDLPGMIAGMSGALAAARINIAQMNLSRDRVGGMAMSILNLDSPADESTLDTIRGIEGITSVEQVIVDS